MFDGTMDPELMRVAQEQMSMMPPAKLARIQQQMFSNPELMKLATENMKNLRPEDVSRVAEELKHVKAGDMDELTKKMANASPEELVSLKAQADDHISYQMSAAETLKKQGNDLHGRGQYHDAANKYLHAKQNMKGIPSIKSATLQLQCSLNLMSCFLKTKQFEDCIEEGTEVLKYDSENVKALYHRGQAYMELGKLEAAVSNLSKAHEFSPEDETIAHVLRDAKEKMNVEKQSISQGFIIEEMEGEENQSMPSESNSSPVDYSVTQPVEHGKCSANNGSFGKSAAVDTVNLLPFSDDPETIRLFQRYVSNADPDSLGAMGLGGMPPDIIKIATEMISSMRPDELQKMFEVASSLKGKDPTLPNMNGKKMTPELIRMASDKISKLPSETLKRVYEFSPSFKSNSTSPASDAITLTSDSGHQSSVPAVNPSSFSRLSSCSTISELPSGIPSSTADLRNPMKDPAMQQNMSREMMANVSEQLGMKLFKEDATEAEQAMASLSPQDLDRMMRWTEKAPEEIEIVKKTKNWLLGRPAMILAIAMLILGFIIHRLGFIGG